MENRRSLNEREDWEQSSMRRVQKGRRAGRSPSAPAIVSTNTVAFSYLALGARQGSTADTADLAAPIRHVGPPSRGCAISAWSRPFALRGQRYGSGEAARLPEQTAAHRAHVPGVRVAQVARHDLLRVARLDDRGGVGRDCRPLPLLKEARRLRALRVRFGP